MDPIIKFTLIALVIVCAVIVVRAALGRTTPTVDPFEALPPLGPSDVVVPAVEPAPVVEVKPQATEKRRRPRKPRSQATVTQPKVDQTKPAQQAKPTQPRRRKPAQ